MKNLSIPIILAHSLVIRIAFLFPPVRLFVGVWVIVAALALIAYCQEKEIDKADVIFALAAFIFAVLGGM
jgi:hypothetical protein